MKLNAGSRLSVGIVVAIEERTARLTILVDPRKKGVFERLCAEEDATPSQVVRRLIRRYIEERTGRAWVPPAAATQSSSASKNGVTPTSSRGRRKAPIRSSVSWVA